MSKVVNKSQQVVTSGLSPLSAYSRIIVVHAAAAGGGIYGFGYSPSFGKETKLLKVEATVQVDLGGQFSRCHFSIHRGTTEPQRYQDVREWEHLIDFGTYAGFRGMVVYGQWKQFSWDMTKRFTTEANRLGVLFYNAGSAVAVVHVFFTIAEG